MPERRSKTGQRPSEFIVDGHERKHDGFFRIEALKVQFRAFGEQSGWLKPTFDMEVAHRGDSVAAILFDPTRREVILVDQFRLATTLLFRDPWVDGELLQQRLGPHSGGWLLETVAGSLRNKKEKPEDCLRREVLEEAGYRITEIKKIAEFFSSPGGTSELLHLYYAEVTDTNIATSGGGMRKAAEDICIVFIPVEEFFDRLQNQEFRDPKIIIGGNWMRDHLARLPVERDTRTVTIPYHCLVRVEGQPRPDGRVIGIKTGNIKDISGVEVWVNPENTNMMMDRPFGRSVSAAIRWAGAEKEIDAAGKERLKRDTIADELRKGLNERHHVGLTDIVETGPGNLAEKGVKRIFHVAIAEGFHEEGLRTNTLTLRSALTGVLGRIENRKRWQGRFSSVLIPMLGTGTSGMSVREVAPELVREAMRFLADHPGSHLKEVWFVAYSFADRDHLMRAFLEHVREGRLEPPSAPDRGDAPAGGA